MAVTAFYCTAHVHVLIQGVGRLTVDLTDIVVNGACGYNLKKQIYLLTA